MLKAPKSVRPPVSRRSFFANFKTHLTAPSKPLKEFNTRQPKFLEPGAFMPPDLQGLLQGIGFYCNNDNEVFSCGWSEYDDNKAYPSISTRIPQSPEEAEDEEQYSSPANSNMSSADDDFKGVMSSGSEFPTRMNNDGSDDDDAVVSFNILFSPSFPSIASPCLSIYDSL